MPFVYTDIPAAAESTTAAGVMYTTNAAGGTLTDHARFLTAAGRQAIIRACYLTGRANAATTITGISVRIIRLATASTAGTVGSSRPRDPGAPAATVTFNTAPTIGTTATLQQAFGCGKAGPGGWVAQDPDSGILLAPGGGANGNADVVSGAQEASLNFDATLEHIE